MKLPAGPSTISDFKDRKSGSRTYVLQVHERYSFGDKEDVYLLDGVYFSRIPLVQAFREIETSSGQIDATIIGPEWSVSDILSIRKITDRHSVPLILHTLKFEWKAKEVAIETGVDEYHIGLLDQQFIKRVSLIKRVKSFTGENSRKQRLRQQPNERPSNKFWFLKRTFDIAISILIILALWPILLLILPLLLLEKSGPLLSTSKRVGRNYKIFNLYKFRSLPSRLGQFLCKAHLVGLPQILNVLVGDMSLVGINPIPVQDAEKLTIDGIAWRFLAPAGVIGLWRFNPSRENKMSNRETTTLDVEYAMTNTLWLDLKILWFYFLNRSSANHHKKEKDWLQRHFPLEMLLSQYISKDKGSYNFLVTDH